MTHQILINLKGDKVICSEEPDRGFTSNYKFSQEINSNLVEVDNYFNPTLVDMNDYFTFYRRKTHDDS